MGNKRKHHAAFAKSNSDKKPTFDHDVFKQVCTTKLFQRPDKEWNPERKQAIRNNDQASVDIGSAIEVNADRSNASVASTRPKESRKQRRLRKQLLASREQSRDAYHDDLSSGSIDQLSVALCQRQSTRVSDQSHQRSHVPKSAKAAFSQTVADVDPSILRQTSRREHAFPSRGRHSRAPMTSFVSRLTSIPSTPATAPTREDTLKILHDLNQSSDESSSDESEEAEVDEIEERRQKAELSGSSAGSFAQQIHNRSENASGAARVGRTTRSCDSQPCIPVEVMSKADNGRGQALAAIEKPNEDDIPANLDPSFRSRCRVDEARNVDTSEQNGTGDSRDCPTATSIQICQANSNLEISLFNSESAAQSQVSPSAISVPSSRQKEMAPNCETVIDSANAIAPDDDLYAMVDQVASKMMAETRPMPSTLDAILDENHNDNVKRFGRTQKTRAASTSSLSEPSRSPSPPSTVHQLLSPGFNRDNDLTDDSASLKETQIPVTPKIKRRMTGITSKHFSRSKQRARRVAGEQQSNEIINVEDDNRDAAAYDSIFRTADNAATDSTPQGSATMEKPVFRLSKRSTGKVSEHFSPRRKIDESLLDRVDLYNTTASSRKVPAGTSTCPVPSIHAEKFGLVQERLWREPFWLIVAVVFLNQTTGRAAMPVFWELKAKYSTMQDLASVDQEEVMKMIQHLGLQNIRSRRIIEIAKTWIEQPPQAGRRFRTLNYPEPGDGKQFKPKQVIEEDAETASGALEIGHMPGCKQYAYDSYRIFCRDVLRGVASDYRGSDVADKSFVPEWQRVLPKDKELRACVRWMWLREGWIWDPLTGAKRRATQEETDSAVQGEMAISDPQERKFAVQAACAECVGRLDLEQIGGKKDRIDCDSSRDCTELPTASPAVIIESQDGPQALAEETVPSYVGDNIVVIPH